MLATPAAAPTEKPAYPDVPVDRFFASLQQRNLVLRLTDAGTLKLTGETDGEGRLVRCNDGIRNYIRAKKQEIIAHLQAEHDKARFVRDRAAAVTVAVAEAAHSHATDPNTLTTTAGYTEADFREAAAALIAAADLLQFQLPGDAGVARVALDEPLPVQSQLLGDIIFASDHCPLPPVHAGALVYRAREIGVLAGLDEGHLLDYHADKRALLVAWWGMFGTGWVFSKQIRNWRDGYTAVDKDITQTNLEAVARQARLRVSRANELLDLLIAAGIAKCWQPDYHRRYSLTRQVTRREQRRLEVERAARAAAAATQSTNETEEDLSA